MSRRRIHFAPLQKPYPKARLRRTSEFILSLAARIERKRLFKRGHKKPHADVDWVKAELKSIVRLLRNRAQNIRRKRVL